MFGSIVIYIMLYLVSILFTVVIIILYTEEIKRNQSGLGSTIAIILGYIFGIGRLAVFTISMINRSSIEFEELISTFICYAPSIAAISCATLLAISERKNKKREKNK